MRKLSVIDCRLKDCDVTWLYGPLKTSTSTHAAGSDASPPPSQLETPTSYIERKPILKKKTASESILQRSLSQHTLLQHAGAILKAQEAEYGWTRPALPRSNTDLEQLHHLHDRTKSATYSSRSTLTASSLSGLTSPSEQRHIHFNNEVVQCIAVEVKEGEEGDGWPVASDGDLSDHGVCMMRDVSSNQALSSQSILHNSLSSDSKTIAPLPSTTLKYRGDAAEPCGNYILDRSAILPPSSRLSPTPSVETLRPSPTSANFLLDENDEDSSLDFFDFTGQSSNQDRAWFVLEGEEEEPSKSSKRLTGLGHSMPCNEEESEPVSNSLLGRILDTVNTARDIAHVIWNVGWRQ